MYGRGLIDVLAKTWYATFTLILGGLAIVLTGLFFPETLRYMLRTANTIKIYINDSIVPANYSIWVELLLESKTLLFAFFVVITRFLVSAVFDLLKWLIGYGQR